MIEIRKLSELAQMGVVDVDNDDLFYVTDTSAGESKSIRKDDLADAINFISSANATDLTDMGDTTLHYHASDRNNANQTGSPLLVSGSDPIIDVQDTDLTNVISRISGVGGILSLVSDIYSQAADSLIELGIDGRRKFSVHSSIAGHDLLNIQFGDSLVRDSSNMDYLIDSIQVRTGSIYHFLRENQEVAIKGAIPLEYNGVFKIYPNLPTIFSYQISDFGEVTTSGTWNAVPICLIFGDDLPTTYSGLLDAATYGSIFFKFTATGINQNQVYTIGQDGAGDKAWKQL